DHDGLPDRWEMTNFGDLKQDGLDDPDKDHANNASEFAAGTNPRDGKQFFRVMIQRSPTGVRLSWLQVAGRLYNVLRSDTLDAWEPVALGVVGSEWADNSPPRAFYRVEVCQDR